MSYRNFFFHFSTKRHPQKLYKHLHSHSPVLCKLKTSCQGREYFPQDTERKGHHFSILQALNQIKMHITGNLLIDSEDRDSALYIIKQLQCITYMFSRLTIICLSIRQHYNTVSFAFFHSSSPIHLALR